VKFLADMPISPKTVAFLRSLGHEALRASERGLDRAKDKSIVEFARAKGMVILTMDLDFTAILARTQAQGPSTMLVSVAQPDRGASQQTTTRIIASSRVAVASRCHCHR
jgi:predicted nuclease of predicted toxin-antitoxin system